MATQCMKVDNATLSLPQRPYTKSALSRPRKPHPPGRSFVSANPGTCSWTGQSVSVDHTILAAGDPADPVRVGPCVPEGRILSR